MKNLLTQLIILFTFHFPVAVFAQTGQNPEIYIETGHSSWVAAVSFSPDGRILASGGWDNAIKLWDVNTGRELLTLTGHAGAVTCIAFSANGKILASGSMDKTVKLWDVATAKESRMLSGHTGVVQTVSFSRDEKTLLSITQNGTAKRWDVISGKELETIAEYKNPTLLSPDGKSFATTSDNTIELWDLESRKRLQTFNGHAELVSSVVFSADGKTLASSSRDKTVKLWNIQSGKELRTFRGHMHFVMAVAFSPDGKILASGGFDRTVKLWDVETGKELRALVGYSSIIQTVTASPTGKFLAVSNQDKTIKIWDLESKTVVRILAGHSENVISVAFSPDEKILASGSRDDTIKLWGVESGKELRTLSGHSEDVASVAFSPNGKILASGCADYRIKLWNVDTGKELQTLSGHSSSYLSGVGVSSVVFSPDGKILASGSFDKTVKLWDVETGKELQTLSGEGEYVYSVSFSPDGKKLASANLDGTIKLWDVRSGEKLRTLTGHSEGLSAVLFSPDKKTLFSGSSDNTIKLWNVESGALLRTFNGHNAAINSITFIKNGKILISGSADGNIKLWNIADGHELCSLINLDDNNWVVATLDGRFDTNQLENPKGLHWIMPDALFTPLSFEVFIRDYFEPRLLPRLLKCTEDENCEREFKPVRDLSSLNRTQPLIAIKGIKKTASPDMVEITVETENVRGKFQKGANKKALESGVYDVRLFRDGQLVGHSTSDENLNKTFRIYQDFTEELKVWRETNKIDLKNDKKTFSFRVKLPTNAEKKSIEFSAYAFNDDRVKSETSRQTFIIPKDAAWQPKPRKAYVIAFGVNKYENAEWNLQFAGNDARAMHEMFSAKLRERKEFSEVVEIPLISDDETVDGKTIEKRDATKSNVRTVLDLLSGKMISAEILQSLKKAIGVSTLAKIKPANPDDLVLISFSSHGYADRNDIFYILPTDIGKDSRKKVPEDLLQHSISSDELSLWLRDVDAGETVMIIDACHAASAVEGKDFKPAPMGSRGLGQLAFDKGMKILAATQAANIAIESGGTIGHGLLTYALLREGFDQNKADFRAKDKIINLKEWLEYGEFAVPQLYEKLAKGELKGFGKGSEKINLNGNDKTRNSLQTPILFDFTKKRQEMILAQLP